MEEVRLGVQEALVKETDLDIIRLEIGDQVLDQLECFLVERLGLEVAFQPQPKCSRIRPQADIGPGLGFAAEQKSEGPKLVQSVLQGPVTADREVSGCDIERLSLGLSEQFVEHVDKLVMNVVDDERDWHGLFPLRAEGLGVFLQVLRDIVSDLLGRGLGDRLEPR